MIDMSRARYVQLRKRSDGHFVIVLLDEDKQEVGFGYKGPTVRRAQLDLRYWSRERGLEELPGEQ